jgi:nucleotide-binding universal stress UspA family protein
MNNEAVQAPPVFVRSRWAGRALERVLVPVDFSPPSGLALGLAMSMVDGCASAVVLFHASTIDDNDEFLDYTGVPWGRSDVIDEARNHLRGFAETIVPGAGEGVRVESERSDDVVAAIVRACARYAPSVLVMGTHARPRRRWRRSTVERVLRKLTCPVVVVRGSPEPSMDADS